MRRIALLAFAALAFLAATSFGAAAVAKRSPLEKRLAKALRVPHVSRAASAAVAVDLQTGA